MKGESIYPFIKIIIITTTTTIRKQAEIGCRKDNKFNLEENLDPRKKVFEMQDGILGNGADLAIGKKNPINWRGDREKSPQEQDSVFFHVVPVFSLGQIQH